jgi:hypothetical protein
MGCLQGHAFGEIKRMQKVFKKIWKIKVKLPPTCVKKAYGGSRNTTPMINFCARWV